MTFEASLLNDSVAVLEQTIAAFRDEVDGTVDLEAEAFLKLLDGIRQAAAFVYGVQKTLHEINEVEDAKEAAKHEDEE